MSKETFGGLIALLLISIRSRCTMARLWQVILVVGFAILLLFLINIGIEWAGNWKGDFPPECGQLQHGDSWNRRSFSPIYTPFWLDDPCTGLGIREPFF